MMELSIYFDELLGRAASGKFATNDIRTFLREMRRTPSGPLIISKLLANKIQSKTEAVALHAFDFLEATLETEVEGSIEFRTEVGRYRFLNEIIRILSPKYLGASTTEKVKDRAIKFLKDAAGVKRKKWFPSEFSKIETVFKSLVDGGVIIQKEDDANDPDAEFRKNIFERGENAVLLKKLLQSKDPNDLQAANRLIKNLVDEEAKRNERRSELHSLIDRIDTSTCLLSEMLSQSHIVDYEIIDELVETCSTLRGKLGTIRTETNEETTSLVQASENIEAVLDLYEKRKKEPSEPYHETEDVISSAQESKKATKTDSKPSSLSLVDELLMGIDIGFAASSYRNKDDGDNNLLNLDIDLNSENQNSSLEHEQNKDETRTRQPYFDEINKMSRELMDQNLVGSKSFGAAAVGPEVKRTEKTSLSQLQLLNSTSHVPAQINQNWNPGCILSQTPPSSNVPYMDLDYLDQTSSQRSNSKQKVTVNSTTDEGAINGKLRLNSSTEDDNLLGLDSDDNTNMSTYSSNATLPLSSPQIVSPNLMKQSPPASAQTQRSNNFQLSSIKDVQFDIDEIELIDNINPVTMSFDENINLALTFGQFPQKLPHSVKAAVITVANKNTTASLLNYVFQLLPPKGVQVKLLPPSCMELPQWKKTFLPPPVLTQLALFIVPPPKSISSQPSTAELPISIKFILSYCLADETVVHNETFLLPHY